MDIIKTIMSIKSAYGALLRKFAKSTFGFWQAVGLHVVPNHFYFPVPDTRLLPRRLWDKVSEMPGVDMNAGGQAKLLSLFEERYKKEYDLFPADKKDASGGYYLKNGAYESVDAEILYSMVRHFKPSRIVEIG